MRLLPKLFKRVFIRIWVKLFQKKVYVFGDSHTEVFQYITDTRVFYKYKFIVCAIGGATAQGLRNPNSKTNATKIFFDEIGKIKSTKSKIFFMLGEVDTGFVIWYRAQKYNESIESQLNQSLGAYFQLIDNIMEMKYTKITIFSAPLPTIEDGQNWGEIANARSEVKATKLERTNLTLLYNEKLRQECVKRKINFISCDKELLNSTTGLIDNLFKNNDPNNHHLDIEKYSGIILSKL